LDEVLGVLDVVLGGCSDVCKGVQLTKQRTLHVRMLPILEREETQYRDKPQKPNSVLAA
jgi:hypothetical protein